MGLVGGGALSATGSPTAALDKVEAILRNPATYEMAAAIPAHSGNGRPRSYPAYAWVMFASLLSVWRSARQVEAELAHPEIWTFMRRIVPDRFPDDATMQLPEAPMARHHYSYVRDRYLRQPTVLADLGRLHREAAVSQARDMGLLDPDGPGSFTHPDLSRMLHADGKVITGLYRTKPGDVRVDERTGKVVRVRSELDAALHYEGDGEAVWGTKFGMVATRSSEGRVILDVEQVHAAGGEAAVAMTCFDRVLPLVPGALGVIYDTALRGTHHQRLLRQRGVVCVNRVAAAENRGGMRTGWKGVRIEKSVHVEDRTVTLADGTDRTVRLYAKAGAIGIAEFSENGESRFVRLKRKRIHRNPLKGGLFAWYQDYVLPPAYGGGTITVRLHANEEDVARGLNRTENVRAIPPGDPDFYRFTRGGTTPSRSTVCWRTHSSSGGRTASVARGSWLTFSEGVAREFPHARTLQASVPMTS